jgi:1,4-dihydroxy-2-naphthoate octaprenyltransferase
MVKKSGIHFHIFLHALRTAIIFVAGFIIYEKLIDLEKEWNKKEPSRRIHNVSKQKSIKFLLVLTIDMILLYILFFIFKIEI